MHACVYRGSTAGIRQAALLFEAALLRGAQQAGY